MRWSPIALGWSDIGGFDALWEAADRDSDGKAVSGPAVLLDTSGAFVSSDGGGRAGRVGPGDRRA